MALQVWLPLTKDLRNQGLSNVTATNNGATFNSTGKLGGCYSFNNSAIGIGATNITLGNTFSIACWIKINSYNSDWANAFKIYKDSYDYIGLCMNQTTASTKQLGFHIYKNNGSNARTGVCDAYYMPLTVGTWYHLCFIVTPSEVKTYQNGVIIRTGSITTTFPLVSNYSLSLGKSSLFSGLDCSINDFRLYNHALSQMEVKELSKGLVLHYPLNRGGLGPSNLLKNGFGELGSENWDNSTNISTSDIPSGQSDIKASFGNGHSIEHINIYPTHTYKFSTWIKGTSTSGYTYPSLFPYDIDDKFINHYNCPNGFDLSTMTTLKQELKTGDTKIYVNDLNQWNANSGHHYNEAAIFSYTDGTGYTYPDGTYTQDIGRFGNSTNAKTNLDKTNNIITLTTAYTGANKPIGTKICASTEGSTYFYPLNGINLTTIQDWTYKEGTFSGDDNRLKYAKYVTFWTYSSNRMAGIKLEDLTNEGMDSTTEYDCSGFCNNGTRTGTFSWTSDTPKYNVSQVFASGNNYIDCGASQEVLPTDGLTVSLWTNYSTWGNPISCTEGGGWNFENSSGIQFSVYVASVGYKVANSGVATSTLQNGWHMLTGTFDKTNVKIYIDGVLKATTATGSTNGIGYAANHCYVGAEAAGSTSIASASLVGKISDVRIYATALSADDVKSLYQNSAYIDSSGNIYGAMHEEG